MQNSLQIKIQGQIKNISINFFFIQIQRKYFIKQIYFN